MVGRGLCATALLFVSAFASSEAAHADGLDDTITTVRRLVREGDTEQARVWVDALTDSKDDRFGALLRELYRAKDDGIAIHACRLLAEKKDGRFLGTLHRRARDEDFRQERPSVHRESIAALGKYASPSSRGVLEKVVGRVLDSDARLASVGITSFAQIEKRSVVDSLIRWLARTEAVDAPDRNGPGGGMSGGPRGGPGTGTGGRKQGEQAAASVRAVAAQVRATILRELSRITGENHADAPTWRKWWRDHRTAFKFG